MHGDELLIVAFSGATFKRSCDYVVKTTQWKLWICNLQYHGLTVHLNQQIEDILVVELHGDVQRRVSLEKVSVASQALRLIRIVFATRPE